MSKDFFKELGRVAKHQVPSELDELILGKNKKNETLSFKWGLSLVPVAALFIFMYISNQKVNELERNRGLLENYEVVTAVEEFDPLELSDEEWDVLLEGRDG